MRTGALILMGVGAALAAVGVVMGYVGGVRADESRPLGITAAMWPVFFTGLTTMLVGWLIRRRTRAGRNAAPARRD